MKKVLMIVVASAASIALVPATALAQHNDRRHHHDRGRHARVHHRTFGHDQGNQGNNQPAGTVVSFTNGVLTIKASDGNMASGKVTNATELRCEQQEPAGMQSHDRGRGDNGGGGDNNRGDNDQGDNDQGDNDRGDNDRGDNDRGDNDRGDNDRGDNQGDNDNDNDEANQMCTTANLVPGAIVQKAKLRISGAGAVWDEVELVTQSSALPNS
jgi:hypothetical protein